MVPTDSLFHVDRKAAEVCCVLAVLFAVTIGSAPPAHAQTFTVLHAFNGGGDGSTPWAGLTMDRTGNLYGTTARGGQTGSCEDGFGCGTVFKLSRAGSGWVLQSLYTFRGGEDGAFPTGRLVIGSDGSFYGTTAGGGQPNCSYPYFTGCGTVFKLTPPATVCKSVSCPWTKAILYRFTGSTDGAQPYLGTLLFDQAGNLYGTTSAGGYTGGTCAPPNYNGCGVVFELTHSGDNWTETVVHTFMGEPDGGVPYSGLIFDTAGNLYGTTSLGGTINAGTVYELSPSGSGWNETVLHSMGVDDDSVYPYGGLIFDDAGNLFGTGWSFYGTVFELSPLGGSWTANTLYSLPGSGLSPGGPEDSLIMDDSSDLYGTTIGGGVFNDGTVFELLPPNGHGWRYIEQHEFAFGEDGAGPIGGVIRDASGNLYGTASSAGAHQAGVVFEITP